MSGLLFFFYCYCFFFILLLLLLFLLLFFFFFFFLFSFEVVFRFCSYLSTHTMFIFYLLYVCMQSIYLILEHKLRKFRKRIRRQKKFFRHGI